MHKSIHSKMSNISSFTTTQLRVWILTCVCTWCSSLRISCWCLTTSPSMYVPPSSVSGRVLLFLVSLCGVLFFSSRSTLTPSTRLVSWTFANCWEKSVILILGNTCDCTLQVNYNPHILLHEVSKCCTQITERVCMFHVRLITLLLFVLLTLSYGRAKTTAW